MIARTTLRRVTGDTQTHLALFAVVILGMCGTILFSRWIDAHRPSPDAALEEERLYITGNAARRMSLGFRGLVADWYWMRSLQYVGGKILSVPEDVQIDHLGQLSLNLLAPLLDTATTLDPEFLEPYEYAAIVLPEVDVEQAIRITRKGIDSNPTAWRLYQQLGYIHWQQRDFQAASEAYGRGALVSGAPSWMEAMRARMAAEGGSRATARELYLRMHEQTKDSQVREMALRRIWQLDFLDQRDSLRKILDAYRQRTGHCPASWRDLGATLRTLHVAMNESGVPLDPSGTPYTLLTNCNVDLDPKSEVPSR